MEYVGRRIKELRKEKGLTLKELGKEIGFNYSNLSKIERGMRRPNVELLERLANYYEVDISYFFNQDDSPTKNEPFHHILNSVSEDFKRKNISIDDLKTTVDTIAKLKG